MSEEGISGYAGYSGENFTVSRGIRMEVHLKMSVTCRTYSEFSSRCRYHIIYPQQPPLRTLYRSRKEVGRGDVNVVKNEE